VPPPPTQIAVAVVEDRGKYLVGQRPDTAPLAGFWEFPGGKVEPGETPQAAARRECREETGLAVDVVHEYPAADYEYAHGRVRLRFFACRPSRGSGPPRPPFRWVAAEELSQYPFPPANAELLRILCPRPDRDHPP
jgi:8-oxo-dGTP diphosphatase